MAATIATEIPKKILREFLTRRYSSRPPSSVNPKYSVDNPPGKIEDRVFIGGNYALMPVLREIENSVVDCKLQPIIGYDFDIPKERTRDYTLRLLFQCRHAIFEETIGNGQFVEVLRTSGFREIRLLQVYMAADSRREPPRTMSIMVWQTQPPPESYLSFDELDIIVKNFLLLT